MSLPGDGDVAASTLDAFDWLARYHPVRLKAFVDGRPAVVKEALRQRLRALRRTWDNKENPNGALQAGSSAGERSDDGGMAAPA